MEQSGYITKIRIRWAVVWSHRVNVWNCLAYRSSRVPTSPVTEVRNWSISFTK
jgi:hypothetical protein